MKTKINSWGRLALAGTLIAGVFSLSSCNKDETEGTAPDVSVVTPTGASASVGIGDSVNFKVIVTSGTADLASVKIESRVQGSAYATVKDSTLAKNTRNITLEGKLGTLQAAGTLEYRFTGTDKDGLSSNAVITITVNANINTYTAVIMGGQSNATKGSFYNTTDNIVYLQAQARSNQGKVDIVYYYGANNMASLACPADDSANIAFSNEFSANWQTRNSTKFKKTTVTPAEFDAINHDGRIKTEAQGMTKTGATKLEAGNVVAFETTGGKKGLAKVVAVRGTTGADREIEITVKIQN